jgi:hypothetical protein
MSIGKSQKNREIFTFFVNFLAKTTDGQEKCMIWDKTRE